jgi:geranylgeranyl diphosphate synthase type II
MNAIPSVFQELLQNFKFLFEEFLETVVYPEIKSSAHSQLAEPMIYSLQAGGKRIRPILCLAAFTRDSYHSKLFEKDSKIRTSLLSLAAATEFIHTYSLIHDDLPSMDNDDLRRGLPTCHIRFSESAAILAGDALNSLGFYYLAKISLEKNDLSRIGDLLKILHEGAGMGGMVSGQSEDLEMEKSAYSQFSELDKKEILDRIHKKKTGALIRASLLLGNRLRKDYQETENFVSDYGTKLGLLFQITDDILDMEGTKEELGKTPGKDEQIGKLTFVSLYGLEEAKQKVVYLVDELKSLAKKIVSNPEEFSFFEILPEYIAKRKV